MPSSLVLGALTILVETKTMQVAGLGIDNLPFYNVRILIGEAAACAIWATCLLVWSNQPRLRLLVGDLFVCFAVLVGGVLSAYGLSTLILRVLHSDVLIYVTSVIGTTVSAVLVVFFRRSSAKRT
jgi:hypothetical protein